MDTDDFGVTDEELPHMCLAPWTSRNPCRLNIADGEHYCDKWAKHDRPHECECGAECP